MSVAETILEQLGGSAKLVVMIGARHFIGYPDAVAFKFPGTSPASGNYCKITLEPSDLYRVEFQYIRAGKSRVVAVFDDIYWDQLIGVFERQTGLYLTFQPRR